MIQEIFYLRPNIRSARIRRREDCEVSGRSRRYVVVLNGGTNARIGRWINHVTSRATLTQAQGVARRWCDEGKRP